MSIVRMKWFGWIFIIEFVYVICAQYAESPCPSYFEYVSDGNSVFGLVHLWPEGPLNSLLLRANFTVSGRLPTNDVGSLEPIGKDILQNLYNNGNRISFRVRFPAMASLPKLSSLTVNDRTICIGPADSPSQTTYITTISLQNFLYLKTGLIPGVPPPTMPSQNEIKQELLDLLKQKFNSSLQNTQKPQFEVTYLDIPDAASYSNVPQNSNGVIYKNEDQFIQSVLQQHLNPTKNQLAYQNRPTSQNRPTYLTSQNRPTYLTSQNRPTYLTSQNPYQDVLIIEEIPDPSMAIQQNNSEELPQNKPEKHPNDSQNVSQTSPPNISQHMNIPTTTTTTSAPPVLMERMPEITTQRQSEASSEIQCGVTAGGNTRVPLIYNGESFSKGDWPWLVAMYKRKDGGLSFICSGTLVSDRHVVTAAHCMQTKSTYLSIKDIVVKVGVYNLEDWGDDFTITRTLASAVIHDSYNSSTLANDILVITFDRRVQYSVNIRPACLWAGSSDLSKIVGSVGVVTGWGQSELGAAGRGEPRMVRMPVVSTATCRASKPDFHKLTSPYTMCAGDRNGAGPCLGDSGAGLYLLDGGRWRLRGVVSLSLRAESGDHSCNLNEYIVFTDAAQYLAWIQYVMNT